VDTVRLAVGGGDVIKAKDMLVGRRVLLLHNLLSSFHDRNFADRMLFLRDILSVYGCGSKSLWLCWRDEVVVLQALEGI